MWLFGPPNVEKMKAKRDVKGLIKALHYENDGNVRSAAAMALIAIGAPAIGPLGVVLADRKSGVRTSVITMLVRIGDARAVEPLCVALKDTDGSLRLAAAGALAQMGDARAVEPLCVALKDGYGKVREVAAGGLVKCGAPAVVPLIAALKEGHSDVRRAAAEALGKIGDARAVEPLCAALKEYLSEVREAAAGALFKFGRSAVEPLIVALKDRDYNVRMAAIGVLGKVGDARAVEPLLAALKHSDSGLREAASGALDKIGWRPGKDEKGAAYWMAKGEWKKCVGIGAPAIEPLIAALKSGQAPLCEPAADALVKIGRPAVAPLIATLKDGSDYERQAAIGVLGQIRDARAVDPLIAVLKDSNSELREAAIDALGQIRDARAFEPLIAALRHAASLVREGAEAALDKMGWQPGKDKIGASYWVAKRQLDKCVEIGGPAVEPLIAALKDSEDRVREAAAAALERVGWQPGQDESAAAYWVIKQKWDRCIDIGAPAVRPLIKALVGRETSARQAAAEVLVMLYQSDLLDDAHKSLILAQRGRISEGHGDRISHHDAGIPGRSSDCTHQDHESHTDHSGIGVAFPV